MSLSRAAGQRPIRGLLLETHDDYLDLAMRAIYCFVYTGANYADVQHEMKLSSEFTNNSLDLQVLTSGGMGTYHTLVILTACLLI